MKSVMMCDQHASRIMTVRLKGSTGVLSIAKGLGRITAARTSTGLYTVVFVDAYAQIPDIFAQAIQDTSGLFLFANARLITQAGFTLECGNEGGANADVDVSILIVGSDSPDAA